jgi:hypothetical protein
MVTFTKTQATLIAQARKSAIGRVGFSTSQRRRGFKSYTEGGREYAAAEKLVELGVFKRLDTQSQVYYPGGGRRAQHWVDHAYQLAELKDA